MMTSSAAGSDETIVVSDAGPSDVGNERRRPKGRWRHAVSRFTVPIFLALIFGLFSILKPSEFFTMGNVDAMVNSIGVTALLALAITLMLRSGGIDFSLAYNMVLAASILGVLSTEKHVPLVAACFIALAIACCIGAFNALLCVTAGLNTFIITLGMGTVLTGVAYAVTDNNVVSNLPAALTHFTNAETFHLQASAGYAVLVAMLLWFLLEKTTYGRSLLVVGGNRVAAELAGLRVKKIKYVAFVLASLIVGFAGLVLAGSQAAVDPTSAVNYLFGPITASFLGATTIQPGRFNVIGTMIALALVTVAQTGLTLLGVGEWSTQVFNGGALVVAMVFARVTSSRREGQAAGRAGMFQG